jgi:opacity protein-like surface antigen
MKNKLTISVLALLLIPFSLVAQRKYYEPEYYIGVTGGVSASRVFFSPKLNQTYLLGQTAGLIFRYTEQKSLGIQMELNYRQRGWKEKNNIYARRLDYLEMPFMTHFYFGKSVRVYLNLGIEGSYLLNEKILFNNTQDAENANSEQYTHPAKNRFDYGFCGGPGLSVNIKGQVIQLDVRASYSLSNIFSNVPKDKFDNSNNMNAAVTLAWLMQFKNKK